METNRVKKGKHTLQQKRYRSTTRYPKKMPTYVVAFAMKESFDDLNIDCSRKFAGSSSASFSASTKTSVDDSKTAHRMASEGDACKAFKEIKIDIDEVYLDQLKLEDDHLESSDYETKNNVNKDDLKQPQVLFDSSKCKRRKSQRKKLKNYRRNTHFKNQSNKLTKKIQRYYCDKHSTVAQIQRDLYEDCITEVVSRYRVVTNALARENLLESINRESANEIDLKQDINSLASTASTERTLNNSLTSQNTLKYNSAHSKPDDNYSMKSQISTGEDTLTKEPQINLKNVSPKSESTSNYSRSDDAISVNTNASVIEVKSETQVPFRSNIINVAIAVTEMSNRQKVSETVKDLLHNQSLTSEANIIELPSTDLTSREPSSDIYESSQDTLVTSLGMKNSSNTTLTLLRNASKSNDSDNSYALPKTKSYIKKDVEDALNLLSSNILTSDIGPTVMKSFLNGLEFGSDRTLKCHQSSSTVFPVASPLNVHKTIDKPFSPTGSFIKDTNDINDVIVTKDKSTKIAVDKARSKHKKQKSLLKKKNSVFGEIKRQKHSRLLNIPNEATLKTMLENEKKLEEMGNFPAHHRTELWEKVTIVLDVIAQRLEHSLADKIIREIKTISNSQHATYATKSFGTDLQELIICNERRMLPEETSLYSHKSFQCSIVDNKMLDNMMLKLSMDGPKILVQPKPPVTKKIEEPNLYKSIEVLKPPEKEKPLTEEVITMNESLTTSTLAAGVRDDRDLIYRRFKYAVKVATTFLGENLFVIVTVPTFFVFIFFMYTMVAVLLRFL